MLFETRRGFNTVAVSSAPRTYLPIQFKRGFKRELLRDKFGHFCEAFSQKSYAWEERSCLQNAHSYIQKGPFWNTKLVRLLKWTGSVLPACVRGVCVCARILSYFKHGQLHVTHSNVAVAPRSNVADTPRSGYATLPRVGSAKRHLHCSFASCFWICVADTTLRRGNVSTFHIASASKCA